MEDIALSEHSKTAHLSPNAATAGDLTTPLTGAKKRKGAGFAVDYTMKKTTPSPTPTTAPNAVSLLKWGIQWTPPTKANARMTSDASTA